MIPLEDSRAGLSKAFGRPDDNRETALSQAKKTFLLFFLSHLGYWFLEAPSDAQFY